MVRAWRIVLFGGCAAACASQLPSEKPLGVGPLALAERAEAARKAPGPRSAPSVAPAPAAAEVAAAPQLADAGAPGATSTSTADAAIPSGGDSGGAAEATDRAAFAGTYRGTDRATVRMAGQPEQTENDPKARVTVVDREPAQIAITLIDSSTGKDICTLSARTAGARAEVAPGQPCFASGPGVSSSVKRGSATLSGKRLTLDLVIELRLDMAAQQNAGSIDYHFEGQRD